MMKHHKQLLGLMIGGTLIGAGATTLQGCDAAEDLCGPCGSIATGQLSIAGNAQLDGFFNAVATFQGATAKVKADFDAEILALGEVFGVAEGTVNADYIGQLKAAIQGEFTANLEGGISIKYTPPKCEANVNVAVEAQASCEASAECDVQVDPGMVSVACEGKCSGGCSGSCSGELSCAVEAPSIQCEGMCEGTCNIEGGAMCDGKCNGECSGTCSATDAEGNCAGTCDGMCTGACELNAAASCEGTCSGTCLVDQGSASCTAEAECRGSCDAECSGSCEGSFEPPSASADCSATAECEAQASAQAEASLECTPPALEFTYGFKAGLDAQAKAEFLAKLDALKVHGVAALQAGARLTALIDGKVDGEVVFNPSPFDNLTGEIKALVDVGISGELDIPAGRLPCVIPAFQEAASALADAGGSVGVTVAAQAEFVTIFTGG